MSNLALIAAQTAPVAQPARALPLALVPRDRPVAPVAPDRQGSQETAPRFTALPGGRGQPVPAKVEQPVPEGRESVPFLAQWIGQDRAVADAAAEPTDSFRHTAISAYRRSQATLTDTPFVFGGSEIVSSALGQRIDLIG